MCYFSMHEHRMACTRSNCWDELLFFSMLFFSMHSFTSVYGQCCQHVAVMFREHH